jgi:hypothetical protein
MLIFSIFFANADSSAETNVPTSHSNSQPGYNIGSLTNPDPAGLVSVSLLNSRRRVQPGKTTPIFGRISRNRGTIVRAQLWADGELVTDKCEIAMNCVVSFDWTPKRVGTNSLVIEVMNSNGQKFSSPHFLVEAITLRPPQIAWGEKPREHLLTTNEFTLTVKSTDSDGKIMLTRVYRDDLGQYFSTNGPDLAIRANPLPPGTYVYRAEAIDDDSLASETLGFICDVDAVEHSDLKAPQGFMVEPATLPRQSRPPKWYPAWPDKSTRIGGASDALQLHWNLPPGNSFLQSTLIKRRDSPTNSWKIVATVDGGISEWRDEGLNPESFYAYRIAFLNHDKTYRTPFTAEIGETTSVGTPIYSVVPIGLPAKR